MYWSSQFEAITGCQAHSTKPATRDDHKAHLKLKRPHSGRRKARCGWGSASLHVAGAVSVSSDAFPTAPSRVAGVPLILSRQQQGAPADAEASPAKGRRQGKKKMLQVAASVASALGQAAAKPAYLPTGCYLAGCHQRP